MLSEYTFLSDHSYSLRPDGDDNDELPLNQRGDKTRKRRRSTTRTNKTASTANRAASIDRSSSDKENNSLVLTSSTRATVPVANISKSSTDARVNKKKPTARSSARATMSNSRTASRKKQENRSTVKTGVKSTAASIVKKKKAVQRGKGKSVNISASNVVDVTPSLSIEERVKLRRTKSVQPSTTPVAARPVKVTKSRISKAEVKPVASASSKKVKSRQASPATSTTKATKLFLGSGLDLDNIVLGNRQRRSVQT